MSTDRWRILVVDDEEDVHLITKMALRKRTCEGRRFSVTSCHSAQEARELLESDPAPGFDVALIDVVMESSDAGLKLCEYVRKTAPRALRIILRTGQPGMAPEESVLRDYDIDYYLAKTEATAETLYTVVRACARASQEIATMNLTRRQMCKLTEALRGEGTIESLLGIMADGLSFMEQKYGVTITHVPDLPEVEQPAAEPVIAALTAAHQADAPRHEVHPGGAHGLSEREFLMLSPAAVAPAVPEKEPGKLSSFIRGLFGGGAPRRPPCGGLHILLREGAELSPRLLVLLASDLDSLYENWMVAYGLFHAHQEILTAMTAGQFRL